MGALVKDMGELVRGGERRGEGERGREGGEGEERGREKKGADRRERRGGENKAFQKQATLTFPVYQPVVARYGCLICCRAETVMGEGRGRSLGLLQL